MSDDDLYSHLMYPQVFADFARHSAQFSDVSVLPTPAFFYGLKLGEEATVSIEEGKTLFLKLVNVSEPDKDGRRTVTFELNGMTREAHILDRGVAPKAKSRAKADLADPCQVRRSHPRAHRGHRCYRGSQSRQGRQAPDDGGDENADDGLCAVRWGGGGIARAGGRHGCEQGLAGPVAWLRVG
jgi:pyruvate carboxylase